jgi:hypothetical protein
MMGGTAGAFGGPATAAAEPATAGDRLAAASGLPSRHQRRDRRAAPALIGVHRRAVSRI